MQFDPTVGQMVPERYEPESDEALRERLMRASPNAAPSLRHKMAVGTGETLDRLAVNFGIQRIKVDRKLDAEEVEALRGVPGVQMTVVEAPRQRRYLPTLADLVDRLTIVQMKAVFIPERRAEYLAEREEIEHDIDLILEHLPKRIGARELHAVMVIMLANRFIWENESRVRNGQSQDLSLLKLTHSINGVRATAKNRLSELVGGRQDYKIDALAADLPPEFGHWKIF